MLSGSDGIPKIDKLIDDAKIDLRNIENELVNADAEVDNRREKIHGLEVRLLAPLLSSTPIMDSGCFFMAVKRPLDNSVVNNSVKGRQPISDTYQYVKNPE